MSADPPAAELVVLVREHCHLCEELLAELREFGQSCALPPVKVLEVDSDPVLARRFGLKIPVLLLDGTPVCAHRFDGAELRRLLRL
ncbi:MAG TPA: glutaredoxin family protein [Steroidobacteraceae bacterium]